MSTGSFLLPKVAALGVGVSLSVVGWNTFSGNPVSARDAVDRLSALAANELTQTSANTSTEGQGQPALRHFISSVKETISNVRAVTSGDVAVEEASVEAKPTSVVVNRGVTSNRNAGGAKFVSSR